MITIPHEGRHYFVQSIVWLSYDEDISDDSEPDGDELIPGVADDSTLSIGFADGSTIQLIDSEASTLYGRLGEHFQTDFQG